MQKMTTSEQALLRLLRTAVGTDPEEQPLHLTEEEWKSAFVSAEQHHVLPLLVDAAYRMKAAVPSALFHSYEQRAMRTVSLQTVKTASFLGLYAYLNEKGLTPLVVKGIICRELYLTPDFRFSADEDLLIPEDQVQTYYDALTAYGLTADKPEEEVRSSFETGYTSKDRLLYIEVHTALFPPDSGAYGAFNGYFTGAYENAVTVMAEDHEIRTLCPTDHLFYLICHALKHFLHGGFGIRQVMDICLFARKYCKEIDWKRMVSQLEAIHGDKFTAALFEIGRKYLKIKIPDEELAKLLFAGTSEPEALLTDILASGVYGSSTLSRKHSSGITLSAVEKERDTAGKGRHSRLRILFPSAGTLQKRYTYIKKYPFLLPIAWGQRIFGYLRSGNRADNSAREALRIGKERTKLLKAYGLLENPEDTRASVKRSVGNQAAPDKVIDTGTYISTLVDLIRDGHEVSLSVFGSSMTPFLGDGRDRVFLRKPDGKLKKGDIVLYRRKNGDYVLHRICRVKKQAERYDMIGDAQTKIEKDIRREQIYAKAVRIERKGKFKTPGSLYWLFFQYIWVRIIPMRHLILQIYKAIR